MNTTVTSGDFQESLREFTLAQPQVNAKMFVGNDIRTSKYTVITFMPKNLIDQFSKLANIYFLIMMILQVIIFVFYIYLYLGNTLNLYYEGLAYYCGTFDIRYYGVCLQGYI